MRIKCKLEKEYSYLQSYYTGRKPTDKDDTLVVCLVGLDEFFCIEDKPELLDIVLTKRPVTNSYQVSTGDAWLTRLDIRASDGSLISRGVYDRLYKAVKKMGGECYVSVEV